ncbi:carboxypeptidase B-like [Galleria mellonella]|uniref:Carboxypeptidase B-like n=1 Tax=Galleria mellonella TaxID=7137 RepID=A0A6J1WUV4_GALME|nr:carboxypeptidase B-like [Galleria mellonella]
MGSWSAAFVLLVVGVTVVYSTPLVNEKQPGQEWPNRGAVPQPSDYKLVETATETVSGEKSEQEVTTDELPLEIIEEEPVEEKIKTDVTNTNTQENEDSDNNTLNNKVDTIKTKTTLTKAETASQKVDYSGAQLWKVSIEKEGSRGILGRLRRRNQIATWGTNGTAIDVFIKPDAIQNVTRVLSRENIAFEVVIEDLQKRIDEENPPLDENEVELQDRRGHRMNWKQYHRLEDIDGFLEYLSKTYPAIISVNSIGKSHEGRELKVLRISNGNPSNKAIFIDGGIHAREWISPATVTYIINQFAENFDEESEDIKNLDWYFLPVMNPDGYEYTHMSDRLWRKNRRPGVAGRGCSGVDLNRNFGYRWGGKGTSSSSCSEIYRGPRAFSEPESRAVYEFFQKSAANYVAYITYHSYGQYILYPWGYENAVPPDYEDLQSLGDKMAAVIQSTGGDYYSVGSSSKLLYPAAGGSDDWAKSQGIKYSYTIELNDKGRYGFVLPTTYIENVAKESLAALRVLAAQVNKE